MAVRQVTPFAFYGITLGAYVGALLWVSSRAPLTLVSALGALGPEASRSGFVSFFAVAGAFCLIVLPVLSSCPGLMLRLWVRGPERAHWSAPQNREEFARRLRRDLFVIGALAAVLLLCTMLASVQATVADGAVPSWFGVSALVVLVAVVGYGLVGTAQYRIPPTPTS